MDAWLFLSWLLAVLSLTGEVRGAVKSTTSSSLRSPKALRGICTSCKVTHRVGNHSVNYGKKITLKCAFDGVSKQNITWFKSGKPVQQNRRVRSSAFNKNGVKLRIKEFSDRDKGLYMCVGHNSQGLKIVSKGYLKVNKPGRKQAIKHQLRRVGKCEPYKGKICSAYISTLIFVDTRKRENSQDFIEQKLSFGFTAIKSNLSDSCKPLPLWCHHNFPECTISNSKAEPKMICKNDCESITKKDCKAEYSLSRRGQSQGNGDDLFPDCSTLPKKTTNGNCIPLNNRHLLPLVPQKPGPTGNTKSGRCVIYRGNLCQNKFEKNVFLPMGAKASHIEKDITNTLQKVITTTKCQPYIKSLLCQLKLPDCDSSSPQPKGKPICKDECLVLKSRYCKAEYTSAQKYADSGLDFDCSSLKPFTHKSGKCSVIGVPANDLADPKLVGSEPGTASPPPRVGFCAPYTGTICQHIIGTKRTIFLDSDNAQTNIETKLTGALNAINSYPKLSPKCKPFVLPLMCHHLFPYCDPTSSSTQPKPSYICRRDCLQIQHHFCPTENEIAEKEALTGHLLFPRCFDLAKSDKGCISLRKFYNRNKTGPIPGDCYDGVGQNYRGFANTTESGLSCRKWDTGLSFYESHHNFCRNRGGRRLKPWCLTAESKQEWCNIPKCAEAPFNGTGEDYLGTINTTKSGKACEPWDKRDPKLMWAHNYCRNPLGSKRSPWCYVGENSWEYCNMPREQLSNDLKVSQLSNLLYTVIPCVVFGLVVGTVIIAVCWKRHKQGPDLLNKNPQPTVTMFLPELKTIPAENITIAKLIGNGRFGTVFNGEIRSNDDTSHVNRLLKVSSKEARNEFINQAMKWSQFHHPNILTIEAMASGDDPITLVFEAASHGSLYQYLIHHSPNNPKFTRDHALLSKENLVDISRQIAAGMTYLSSHGYVHGDLMTRNCQVAHSMVIKITDFSIDRDVCYYRRPNKRPTPIGWIAPETIHTEVFTGYSDIWAFGVLLWEIFTYGFQPYFGYTFLEVKKKILDMELLECPRECNPFIYDLMRKCWQKNPTQRPQFFDLHEVLNNLSNQLLGAPDDDKIHLCIGISS